MKTLTIDEVADKIEKKEWGKDDFYNWVNQYPPEKISPPPASNKSSPV
jgi:hypothetical protein